MKKIKEKNKLDANDSENEEENKLEDSIQFFEGEEKMGKKPKKRIHNPVTGTYYEIRQRTTKHGIKGQFKGKWKPPKKQDDQKSTDSLLITLSFGILSAFIGAVFFGVPGALIGFIIGGSIGAIFSSF